MANWKKFYVEFELPDLPEPYFRQIWTGDAMTIGKAVFNAFKEIRKRKGVKGRRLKHMKVTSIESLGPKDSEV